MAELSMFWDGSTVGDAGPYSDDDVMDTCFRALLAGTGNEGVLDGWLNELVYSFPAANTCRVATGGAIIYGLWYENDANVDVNVPNGPRTDLIVVRRSWAAATARITRIAGPGAAVTQNPGVTYDIPLYTVDVDGAGTVTLNTDLRDYCEFSTDPQPTSVTTAMIVNDAVTTGKLANQTRWLSRGAGTLHADGTNAAAWVADQLTYPAYVYRDMWRFQDAVTDSVWMTFRVPEDFTGASVTVYLWLTWFWNPATGAAANQYWGYSAWVAASGAALANQAANATFAEDTATWFWEVAVGRFTLGTINVAAGDIVHCRIDRLGGHGNDTSDATAYLFMAEIGYTADS